MVRLRLGDRKHLEHRSHAAAAAVGQALQRGGNIGGNFRRGFPISVAARVSMPSRLRKSPCVTGP